MDVSVRSHCYQRWTLSVPKTRNHEPLACARFGKRKRVRGQIADNCIPQTSACRSFGPEHSGLPIRRSAIIRALCVRSLVRALSVFPRLQYYVYCLQINLEQTHARRRTRARQVSLINCQPPLGALEGVAHGSVRTKVTRCANDVVRACPTRATRDAVPVECGKNQQLCHRRTLELVPDQLRRRRRRRRRRRCRLRYSNSRLSGFVSLVYVVLFVVYLRAAPNS